MDFIVSRTSYLTATVPRQGPLSLSHKQWLTSFACTIAVFSALLRGSRADEHTVHSSATRGVPVMLSGVHKFECGGSGCEPDEGFAFVSGVGQV